MARDDFDTPDLQPLLYCLHEQQLYICGSDEKLITFAVITLVIFAFKMV